MSERTLFCHRCGTMPSHICIPLPSVKEGTAERPATGLENQGGLVPQGFDSSTLRQEHHLLCNFRDAGPAETCKQCAMLHRKESELESKGSGKPLREKSPAGSSPAPSAISDTVQQLIGDELANCTACGHSLEVHDSGWCYHDGCAMDRICGHQP